MFCPKCGTNIPDEALFCPKCGAQIPHDAPDLPPQPQQVVPQQNYNQNGAFYTPVEPPKQNSSQNGSFNSYSEPPKKSKAGLFLALIIVAGLAAGLWFYGKPMLEKYIGGRGSSQDSSINVIIPESSISSSQTSEVSTSAETGSSTAVTSSDTSVTPESSAPVPESSATEVVPEPPASQPSSQASSSVPPATQTHSQDLSFDSFKEGELLLETGIPNVAEWQQPYTFQGDWGYEMIFDEIGYSEIGDCHIEFGQNAVTLDLYPTFAKDGYEMYPTSREEIGYNTFSGSMREEEFILEDPGHASTISIGTFITLDGKEYAYGSIATSSGLIGTLIFIKY